MMATWWQGPAEEFTEVSRAGWEHGVNIMHFLGGCRVTVAGDRAIAQTKMTIMQRGVVHGVRCDVACTGRFYDFFERRHQPAEQRGAGRAEQGGARPAEQRRAGPAEQRGAGRAEQRGAGPAEQRGAGRAEQRGAGPAEQRGAGPAEQRGARPAEQRAAQPADRPGGESGESRWAIVLRQPIYEKDRLDPVDPAATVTLDPDLLNAFPEGYRHLAYLQTHLGFAVKPDMPGLRGPEVQRLYARGAAWLDGEPVASPARPAGPEPAEAFGAPEPVWVAGIAVTVKGAAMTEPTSPPGVPIGLSITARAPTTTTSSPDADDHTRPVTP